jgi:hypothetical protein
MYKTNPMIQKLMYFVWGIGESEDWVKFKGIFYNTVMFNSNKRYTLRKLTGSMEISLS